MTYVLFVIGFIILIKGADLLVDGASSIAKRYKISDIVIGLTIVAFGTSAPELMVNLIASYQGNAELAVANVLGSNIANTLVAIGIAAIISPLVVKRNTVLKEIPLEFLAALVVGFMANDILIDVGVLSQLSRIDGLVMLCFFGVFLSYTLSIAKDKQEKPLEAVVKGLSIPYSIAYVLLGLVGLGAGGHWIVEGAVEIARTFGMSEALIGTTIIAIGTSLPEIVTSAMSAMKGKKDIAIGNAVGSNIFNIFWVLALSSTLSPLPFNPIINMDILVNIGASALLFLFLYVSNPKHELRRVHGILFIFIYIGYLSYTIYRG